MAACTGCWAHTAAWVAAGSVAVAGSAAARRAARHTRPDRDRGLAGGCHAYTEVHPCHMTTHHAQAGSQRPDAMAAEHEYQPIYQ